MHTIFPEHLLDAKSGDDLKLILYNLHTDELDEVSFKLKSHFKVGEKSIWLRGQMDNTQDHYYEIKIEYDLEKPLESHILVFASAPPDYSCFLRL